MKGFATRLLEARARAGMSQFALAKKIGVTPVQISRYERGECEPRMGVMYRISDALGVTPEWLTTGEKASPPGLRQEAHDISVIPTAALLSELSRRCLG